jgi:predicted short-subunit dehydrogenase-like oxidoreductase (DUF2520 family)
MRELERESDLRDLMRMPCAIVGAGRIGRALHVALHHAGVPVDGPHGRGFDGADADLVLLCVPDGEIANAAAAVLPRAGRLVGHCSGATTLAPLAPHEAFSLHPLMTVPGDAARQTSDGTEPGDGARPARARAQLSDAAWPTDDTAAPAPVFKTGISSGLRSPFAGATAAVAGSTPRALAVAHALAATLSLTPVDVADEDRAAYHAAASIASNFLVTLEAAAERLASTAGLDRAALVPLVRAALENWAALGPARALTGPVARGDELTVARQRAAVQQRTPELVELFDALTAATRELSADARRGGGDDEAPREPGGGDAVHARSLADGLARAREAVA